MKRIIIGLLVTIGFLFIFSGVSSALPPLPYQVSFDTSCNKSIHYVLNTICVDTSTNALYRGTGSAITAFNGTLLLGVVLDSSGNVYNPSGVFTGVAADGSRFLSYAPNTLSTFSFLAGQYGIGPGNDGYWYVNKSGLSVGKSRIVTEDDSSVLEVSGNTKITTAAMKISDATYYIRGGSGAANDASADLTQVTLGPNLGVRLKVVQDASKTIEVYSPSANITYIDPSGNANSGMTHIKVSGDVRNGMQIGVVSEVLSVSGSTVTYGWLVFWIARKASIVFTAS
jgi:hypothetical protein